MSIARQPLSARCRQGRGQGDAMAQSGRRTAQRGAAPWLTRLPFSAHSARGAVATGRDRDFSLSRTYFIYHTLTAHWCN